jgi:hypothetical protein
MSGLRSREKREMCGIRRRANIIGDQVEQCDEPGVKVCEILSTSVQ